jgi:hypothetical protein
MSQLTKLDQQLSQAKTVKDLFTLPMVRDRFIKNYELTTGRKDGENYFEQERFAYLEAIADKPDLHSLEKFWHFAAIVKAGTTGLSFRDKSLYLIPQKKDGKIVGLKVDSSPSGKRKQMENMKTVKRFPEAILVMKGEEFVHDKLNNVVIKHISTEKSNDHISMDNIRAAYQRIQWSDGTWTDVVVYHDDLVKARSKTKTKADDSAWNSFPGEMCKKTATNRAFNRYHKYTDGVVVYSEANEEDEDEVNETSYSDVSVQPSTFMEIKTETVDTETGEVNPLPEDKDTPNSFM